MKKTINFLFFFSFIKLIFTSDFCDIGDINTTCTINKRYTFNKILNIKGRGKLIINEPGRLECKDLCNLYFDNGIFINANENFAIKSEKDVNLITINNVININTREGNGIFSKNNIILNSNFNNIIINGIIESEENIKLISLSNVNIDSFIISRFIEISSFNLNIDRFGILNTVLFYFKKSKEKEQEVN
jgi:hypothetical protein